MPLEKWATQAGFSHCERGWTGSGASKTEVGPLEAPPGRATWDRAGRGGTSIGPAGPPLDRAQILPLVIAERGMAASGALCHGFQLPRAPPKSPRAGGQQGPACALAAGGTWKVEKSYLGFNKGTNIII